MVVYISLANGDSVKEVFSSDAVEKPGWLGISDANGDGRDEVWTVGTMSGSATIREYDGQNLVSVGGDLRDGILVFGRGVQTYTGISCETIGDQFKLRTFAVHLDTNRISSQFVGSEVVYAPDADGDMRKVSTKVPIVRVF